MNPNISRRQFFSLLVPSWMTRRNLMRAGLLAVFIAASFLIYSIVREADPVRSLQAAGVIIGLFVALWCLARVIDVTKRVVKRSPPLIQAIVTVVMRLLFYLVAAVPAIVIYRRWERGDDMTETWVSIGIGILMMLVAEIEKKKGEPDATDNPDDAQRVRENY